MNVQLPSRRVALAALVSVATLAGCNTPEQPMNPTDSTVEQRRPDEVPRGKPVAPVDSSVTPGTGDMNPPATSDGG